jgi:small ligand-binding sensory domain FIST
MAEPVLDIAAPRFAAGFSTGPDWGACAKACLNDLGALPAGANLGFLYATDALADDLGSMLAFLRGTTGIQHWVGSVGLGVAASGIEAYERPAVSVLAAALDEESFRVFPPLGGGAEDGGLARFESEQGDWLKARAPVLGIAHADPRTRDLAETLSGFSAATSSFMIGGLASSRGAMPQICETVTEGGMSGVLFEPAIGVAVGLSQGCAPIGATHTVTKALDDVIMEIDERPALDVFKEDIGELLAHDLRRVGGYIFAGFPIAGSDTADYLVRNLTGIDTGRGWIQVGEAVESGRRVLFCRRDHDSALIDLRRMVQDVMKRAGGTPKAALYYSCIARGRNLFGTDSQELKLLQEELGEVPLTGFFANGEIFNDRLYGYTGVLAVFS